MNVLSANQPSLEGKGGVGSETIYQQIWKELMKLKSLFLMIKSISILSLLIKIWHATIHIVLTFQFSFVRYAVFRDFFKFFIDQSGPDLG